MANKTFVEVHITKCDSKLRLTKLITILFETGIKLSKWIADGILGEQINHGVYQKQENGFSFHYSSKAKAITKCIEAKTYVDGYEGITATISIKINDDYITVGSDAFHKIRNAYFSKKKIG